MKNPHRSKPTASPRALSTALQAGLLLACCGLLAGCGESYDVVPVSGTVTMDGNPVADVVVTFQPASTGRAGEAGLGSHGVTDAQGKYTLQLSGKEQPGAVVGKHRVTFAAKPPVRDVADDTAAPPPTLVIPARYQTEPLEFEVPAGGSTAADFPLTSQGSGSSGGGSSWPGGGS